MYIYKILNYERRARNHGRHCNTYAPSTRAPETRGQRTENSGNPETQFFF